MLSYCIPESLYGRMDSVKGGNGSTLVFKAGMNGYWLGVVDFTVTVPRDVEQEVCLVT